MKEILNWLKKSNRWKHLLGGIAIGFGSDNWYCTEYTGILVAGSLELKDKLWGGKIDIIDFILTVIGANIGYLLKYLIF